MNICILNRSFAIIPRLIRLFSLITKMDGNIQGHSFINIYPARLLPRKYRHIYDPERGDEKRFLRRYAQKVRLDSELFGREDIL